MNEPFANPPVRATQRATQPNQKYCFNCRNVLSAQAARCPVCGAEQLGVQRSDQHVLVSRGRHRIATAIIAIVLGNFGIHRFYLGHFGLGVLYLLFSWTYIPAIIGVIEGIRLLRMPDIEFELKYNRKLATPNIRAN